MTPTKRRPKDVNEYIELASNDAQAKLRAMRQCIRKAAPGAIESIKWGMPSFSYQRMLVAYAAFKNHIGFYPTPSAVTAFAKDLSKYHTARGSIQFPLDQPLPLPLVRKITAFRVKESLEKDAKWRTPSMTKRS